ncbi:MAG: GNAT family N-acetyltransferase [Phycisphaerales bacterium]|nr:GNAT family N-acetyltransferase [Phycisphaerales bacterium]
MHPRRDDPTRPAVAALLRGHLAELAGLSPPESMHALDVSALCAPGITFWSLAASEDPESEVIGCGALLELDPTHGEIKSMRTAKAHLRRGVASTLLRCILDEARARGYSRLSLETGSQEAFAPARTLYTRFGFVPCGPFGRYREDPNSVFMSRVL